MPKRTMTRDERYEAFKKQVEWDGWSGVTRKRFDELFPEPEDPIPSITELLGMRDDEPSQR